MPTAPKTHAQRLRDTKPKAPDDRATACQRGYDGRWRKARLGYLRSHPLCVVCGQDGRVEPATVVDHIVPHRGDRALFWNRDNWQALCALHHNQKTGSGS